MHLEKDEDVEAGWGVYLMPVDNPVDWEWLWDDVSLEEGEPNYHGYAWVSRAKYDEYERQVLARYGIVKP
jgi:hypothetical protein